MHIIHHITRKGKIDLKSAKFSRPKKPLVIEPSQIRIWALPMNELALKRYSWKKIGMFLLLVPLVYFS